MKKSAHSKGNRRADVIEVDQRISIDFGFMVQKSKNKDRIKALISLDGSRAYMIVTNYHSNAMLTVCTGNKCPPISWLNKLLTKFERKGEIYAVLDLGGELGRHPKVNSLLQQHGYTTRPTAPNASYQNALGECPHQTIANALRT
eukprot:7038254-Ditylum_brightwellii.AAC.1